MTHDSRESRLLFVVNDAAFFLSHRLPIAIAAQRAGYRVSVATANGPAVTRIEAAGIEHHILPLSRSSRNPFKDLVLFAALLHLFRRARPDIVHLVTIKPVLYGSLVARIARVPSVVAAVPGLGFVFIGRGWRSQLLRTIVGTMYAAAFRHPRLHVVFQNQEDLEMMTKLARLGPGKTTLVPGSGVDLDAYDARPRGEQHIPIVLMAARLLRDKGVNEFVAAARLLRTRGVVARFQLAGDPDPGNPSSIDAGQLAEWRAEGTVELLGFRADMSQLMAESDIVVLPSYREGMPKVLLEAAAGGRPVVTTDVPGCRDAIESGISGLLVPARDTEALAGAIARLIADTALRARMGRAGRELAERRFSIESVVKTHLSIYRLVTVKR